MFQEKGRTVPSWNLGCGKRCSTCLVVSLCIGTRAGQSSGSFFRTMWMKGGLVRNWLAATLVPYSRLVTVLRVRISCRKYYTNHWQLEKTVWQLKPSHWLYYSKLPSLWVDQVWLSWTWLVLRFSPILRNEKTGCSFKAEWFRAVSTIWKKIAHFWRWLFSELKKDPGIPRLPDLKMKLRNRQKKPTVRVTFD